MQKCDARIARRRDPLGELPLSQTEHFTGFWNPAPEETSASHGA
jgi:hypothetical protein